ncbi:MAG: hypothetical protein RLN87_11755 [Parasphingopyxis sp.]|uniref:hypothetical protein n=1 Tax=uncultured Parasphingopyxis sp. TaxID=1547918 RepID=UPI0026272F41|nr:hypothetical protein [uncultured Parasphingopyxis sp.]
MAMIGGRWRRAAFSINGRDQSAPMLDAETDVTRVFWFLPLTRRGLGSPMLWRSEETGVTMKGTS